MNNLTPGIVSITFRQLIPSEIIALAVEAQTPLIEWGGDIHVPHGDIARAREVGAMTRDAGLRVAAYGSYYRVGTENSDPGFEPCLESALALGAPIIRVWPGTCGSADTDTGTRERVVADLARISRLASEAGVAVACEYHGGTLTDTLASALRLLTEVNHPGLRTLWQPLGDETPEARVSEIETLTPWLANIHVYHWPGGERVPLAEGKQEWQACLAALAKIDRPFGLLLEHVRDEEPAQFLQDAAVLREWIAQV